ncbi:hypothetical protein B0H14DRAFT_1532167 [Mycena olivaceomarginata]|nr:hypothetical protein B0H14DRAFT_1532167 [Mycena olivaceomarginata]
MLSNWTSPFPAQFRVSSTPKTTIHRGSFWNTSCGPTPTQRLSKVHFYFGLQIPTARRPSAERTGRFLPLSTFGLLPRAGNTDSRGTPCFWPPVTINPSRAQFCVTLPSLLFRRVVRPGAAPSAVAQAKRLPLFRACTPGCTLQDDKRDTHAMRAGPRARGVLVQVAIGGDGGRGRGEEKAMIVGATVVGHRTHVPRPSFPFPHPRPAPP